jgi:hypothetical protein
MTIQAASDPVNVSSANVWMDVRYSSPCTTELYVQSTSIEPVEVSVSSWWNYILPEEESKWINPAWLTRISPDTQMLKPGEKMLVNIEVTLPDSAPEVKYQTWIKVAVGSWEKPITINVRKGAAIPTYKYGVSPGYFALLATGPGAKQTVNTSDTQAIVVSSQCSADTIFMMSPESGCEDFTVSSDQVNGKDNKGNYTSKMFGGKQQYLGTKWKGLSEDEIAKWFQSTATEETPLRILPYSNGRIGWTLSVPDNTVDGNYWFWVRLEPAEPNPAMIGTEYLVKFFVTVERNKEPSTAPSTMWYFIIGGGVASVIGMILLSARKSNKVERSKLLRAE